MTTVARRTFANLNTISLLRREFLQLAASATILPAWPRVAAALDYPTRPVRVLVGFTPGSAPDILARLIAQWLSDCFAQPFIVENKPGGRGSLATEAVINAAPDGYTLLVGGISVIRDQRDALRKPELRCDPRSQRRRRAQSRTPCDGCQSSISGQDSSRIHKIRPRQSGETQYGLPGNLHVSAHGGRVVQVHGRR